MEKTLRNPMFRYLMVLTIASVVGLQGWRTLFNNFAVEQAYLEGFHIGIIQGIREVPGFLTLLAIYVMLIIREHRLSAISVLILAAGVTCTGFFPNFAGLIVTTLVMSFGFHYYETTNQSLTLQYFDKATSPWVFGKLKSLSSAANIGIGLTILLMSNFMSYTQMYVLIGVTVAAAGIWALREDPTSVDIVPQHKKMIFRKKYWLFYLLTFLAGARRQIFVAFAVFLMVKVFKYSIQMVTILFVVNNVVNYFLAPMIGKAIIHFGERKVLSLEYFSLVFIFIAYAFTDSAIAVGILYVLDHVFFNFAIAIRTFFQKIADPADIAPSMAVGFTINHIAAVAIPAFGGLLWMVDYKIPFIAGACLSTLSLVAVQRIKV
ncbi:MAG: MFS transporter [Spirochaetota bacterium]